MEYKRYTIENLETAACIWEAVLELQSGARNPKGLRRKIESMRERMGTSALRLIALRWTELVDADWAKVRDSYPHSFDWDFVPEWIQANIDWSGERPVVKLEGRS